MFKEIFLIYYAISMITTFVFTYLLLKYGKESFPMIKFMGNMLIVLLVFYNLFAFITMPISVFLMVFPGLVNKLMMRGF